ncbi:hypothetical protein K0M31_019028 [Melipona bicolor]|uniref:Uncharacterized protein n=1 Tax=Melipona bicolor TaxID=60889 RepID=A0AA40KDT6_9HYME|nr:hypothetical protein K0M31_019028 [Melipona bicolor]
MSYHKLNALNVPFQYFYKKSNCLKCQEFENVREKFELHLTGIQIEEALAEDKQTALIQHLNLSTNALEALVQYGQSLQVSQLAACRVLNISHLLAFPQSYSINSESDTTHLSMHLHQLEEQTENKLIVLQDLMEHCSKHIVLSRHFNELMNNHCMRKKDFHTATKNFKNFLNNFTLSISQIQKLHQQYDTILNNYQQSRCILDLELPKMISTRSMALYEGFEKIKTFCNNTADDNEIVALFKLIGDKLYTKGLNAVTISQLEDSSKSKLCQKCKINHVDDK